MIARARGPVSWGRRVGRAVLPLVLYPVLFAGAWVLLGMVARVLWWAFRVGWRAFE